MEDLNALVNPISSAKRAIDYTGREMLKPALRELAHGLASLCRQHDALLERVEQLEETMFRTTIPTPSVAQTLKTPDTLLSFLYTNWRGDGHRYVVIPTGVELATTAQNEHTYGHWVLHADVVFRDGEKRSGRRTFVLKDLRNVVEINKDVVEISA